MPTILHRPSADGAIARALRPGLRPLGVAALFSLASNILYLALPIYTNQVFGRVLASQSLGTLAVLTGGTLFVFALSAAIDHHRGQVLAGVGAMLDEQLATRAFAALFDAALGEPGLRSQALRDLDAVRQTVAGAAINMLFDLPWIPIFLLVLFLVAPAVGAVTAIGGLTLVALAAAQDRATRRALRRASDEALAGYAEADGALRNAEVVAALGMLPTLGRRWARRRFASIDAAMAASERGAAWAGALRLARTATQVLTVAVSAWLVIDRAMPASLLFANMILSARALAPLDRVVTSWNVLTDGIAAAARVDALLARERAPARATRLPAPEGRVSVEGVFLTPPGAAAPVLANLSLQIAPGEFIGLAGPSGAGKSTLARLVAGVWRPTAGVVRLDGAALDAWAPEDRGRHVAYQPQDTELFAGSVRDNIARFRDDATDEAAVAAARAAGAHELIVRLPRGYDTELGPGGAMLSAGQRQRVGLARTLFGDPRVLVLDEPNANLDSEGEAMLAQALAAARARGATIVLISHKPAAFAGADRIVVLAGGRIVEQGPAEAVLARWTGAAPRQPVLEAVS